MIPGGTTCAIEKGANVGEEEEEDDDKACGGAGGAGGAGAVAVAGTDGPPLSVARGRTIIYDWLLESPLGIDDSWTGTRTCWEWLAWNDIALWWLGRWLLYRSGSNVKVARKKPYAAPSIREGLRQFNSRSLRSS